MTDRCGCNVRLRVEGGEEIKLSASEARIIEGISPTVDVERVEGGMLVTVEDYEGVKTATVYDGERGPQGIQGEPGPAGADGSDGHSPVVTASKSGKTTTISVDGAVIATVNDGNDGADGAPGADGHDYVLTAQDKQDIAEIVLGELPSAVGVEF